MSTLEQEIHTIGRRAREASRSLARLTADQKNANACDLVGKEVRRCHGSAIANASQ